MGSKAPSRVRIPQSPPLGCSCVCNTPRLTDVSLVRHNSASAPVAQLDRAPGYELGGRRFESFRARHHKSKKGQRVTAGWPFFFARVFWRPCQIRAKSVPSLRSYRAMLAGRGHVAWWSQSARCRQESIRSTVRVCLSGWVGFAMLIDGFRFIRVNCA